MEEMLTIEEEQAMVMAWGELGKKMGDKVRGLWKMCCMVLENTLNVVWFSQQNQEITTVT
ncbi:hypothetical protein HanIR_Chr01g0034331 [Helianthus annuus]|nr:hypothetical protein HanIR_Chr01g0034331 [Helianthus annuus]